MAITERIQLPAPTAPEEMEQLLQDGYYMADRLLKIEIPLSKLKEDLHRMVRFEIKTDGITIEEIYELARTSFPIDRRFHPQIRYNQEAADPRIRDYIQERLKAKNIIVGAYYKGEMIGFNCFIEPDGTEKTAENILGAVAGKYQKTGAAVSLYAGAALHLRDLGYEKLTASISSANTASLNMHLLLGNGHTKVTESYDIWYYSR